MMFDSFGRRHRGGGHNPSLIALGVLGVMMMAAVIGVVAMDDEQEADAAVGSRFTVDNLTYKVLKTGNDVGVYDAASTISGSLSIPSSVSDGSKQYNVTSIEDNAFKSCSKLTSITIPNSVTSIGRNAFEGCSGLTSLTIPNSITHIGMYVFEGCSGLTSITIPNSVKSIASYAFKDCSKLTSVTIPDSVTSISGNSFLQCSEITKFIVDADNTNYSSVDGVLFNKDATKLITYTAGIEGHYTIPDSVTSIGPYAFQNCSKLTSITIPDSVTSIGANAFYRCSGLASMTFTSQSPPAMTTNSFCTSTTTEVTSPWNPVTAMADSIGTDGKTTIVWANPSYPDLTFLSNPVTNGTLAYNPTRTSKTALTA